MDLIVERYRGRCRHIAEHEHDPLRGQRRRAEHHRRRAVRELRAFRDAGGCLVWGKFAAVEVYSEQSRPEQCHGPRRGLQVLILKIARAARTLVARRVGVVLVGVGSNVILIYCTIIHVMPEMFVDTHISRYGHFNGPVE
jgi:hypothetical protein